MKKHNCHRPIVLAVGGTGGHIFPSQVVANELAKEHQVHEVLFMGGRLNRHGFFKQSPYAFYEIESSSFTMKGIRGKAIACKKIVHGICKSLRLLRKLRPALVVSFGSYHAFPVLVAARLLRIKLCLFESNVIPGRVHRLFSRSADFSGAQFMTCAEKLKGKVIGVRMPMKHQAQQMSQEQALKYFDLPHKGLTFLVFGGSQGAWKVNYYFCQALSGLIKSDIEFQVIHFIGFKTRKESIEKIYGDLSIRACVRQFEEKMHYAWHAADLTIGRAGAGTIAEHIEFEVPGILIPLPSASEDHQRINAQFFQNQIKGGVYLEEASLTPSTLVSKIESCINLSEQMKASLRRYKQMPHRVSLSAVISKLLRKSID